MDSNSSICYVISYVVSLDVDTHVEDDNHRYLCQTCLLIVCVGYLLVGVNKLGRLTITMLLIECSVVVSLDVDNS
jgi:hypothetical protein